MKNKTHSPEEFHPILQTLLKDGLLLPTQAQTIHNLSNSSKKDVEYLLLALGLASERTLQSYLQQQFGVTSLMGSPEISKGSLFEGEIPEYGS